jgi:hypothetical protein
MSSYLRVSYPSRSHETMTREELDRISTRPQSHRWVAESPIIQVRQSDFDRLLATAKQGVEDRERLDWIQGQRSSVNRSMTTGRWFVGLTGGDTLRAAIDAAELSERYCEIAAAQAESQADGDSLSAGCAPKSEEKE